MAVTRTLTSINNLATLLYQQGEEGEAKRFCPEAVTSSKEVLGVDHPDTRASTNNPWGIR